MVNHTQHKIPAMFIRGGTSKGVFFHLADLPKSAQIAGRARDELMLRIIGSPDPYGKHIDGMGGGMSSNSKVAILSKSDVPDHDINYLFGQPAIGEPIIDWSGNCGNLTAAAAAFAISKGLVKQQETQREDVAVVRIWQQNIRKTIVAHVPMSGGKICETGEFLLDGVPFPAAEVKVEFIEPIDSLEVLFPTGNVVDELIVPGLGALQVTMINAGIPTVFLAAHDLGYSGHELPRDVNGDPQALKRFELIRKTGSVKMGLAADLNEASRRMHTPKLILCSEARTFVTTSGAQVKGSDIDINLRAFSMGRMHHAMMGTGAVAIGAAAAIPGTIVNLCIGSAPQEEITFGHPAGKLSTFTSVSRSGGSWQVEKTVLSRSARILMEGYVRVPTIS